MGVGVKYCNENWKLQIFLEFPEYQVVTSEVLTFSSEYAELQNTSQQEIAQYSVTKLVSPPFLMKLMTPCHKTFFKRALKNTLRGLKQVFQIIKGGEC